MKRLLSIILVGAMLIGLTACSGTTSTASTSSQVSSSASSAVTASEAGSAVASSQAVASSSAQTSSDEIKSTGPNGEKAVNATTIKLTDEEITKVKAGNYTAAVCFHYNGNDWSTSQLKGLTDTFNKLGIKIIATTDANFSVEKQVSQIETVMAKKPNIMVSIPVDATSTADAYKKVANAGIKLVFMDNVPKGFTAGKDYVSCVSADNYGNGLIAADLIGEKLKGTGKIGVIYYDADFFVTNQRLKAFQTEMSEKYPKIQIVSKMGFQDNNKCSTVADAMLTQHPEIQAIFAHWDVPCEGVLSSLKAAGRSDIFLSTMDLGNNIAKEIAKGTVLGVGAQLPYDQGVAEATLAAYSMIGKEAPAYVAVPAKRVDQTNILEGYTAVYHVTPPDWLTQAKKSAK